MRLRPYISNRDFDSINGWIRDGRTHALWCAGRFGYPLDKADMDGVLSDHAERYSDCAFVATDDSGKVIGFFCYSLDPGTNIGMLKFVMIDDSLRGRGVGREMIKLAVKYAFEISKADAVRLMVFDENAGAKKCYLGAGFSMESVTENAFRYNDESWARCSMVIHSSIQQDGII